ncbi:hypothetical protein CC78DRAFT_80362 [Lojkania enalia]|uniref:Uncharacterized protein n=1 Tax=Lojkania enalia TaxID=147567 RepID=A0A9P4KE15_9PLEO|nr:hypothetical protein CC78DRAFT_80362 [Didymosphaeria enalia]
MSTSPISLSFCVLFWLFLQNIVCSPTSSSYYGNQNLNQYCITSHGMENFNLVDYAGRNDRVIELQWSRPSGAGSSIAYVYIDFCVTSDGATAVQYWEPQTRDNWMSHGYQKRIILHYVSRVENLGDETTIEIEIGPRKYVRFVAIGKDGSLLGQSEAVSLDESVGMARVSLSISKKYYSHLGIIGVALMCSGIIVAWLVDERRRSRKEGSSIILPVEA